MSTDERRVFELRYGGASEVVAAEGGSRLALFGNALRDDVAVTAKIPDALRLREALSALYEVVQSDFRYKPKDRTAYLAFQNMRKQSIGMAAWEARQAWFDWLAQNDPDAWNILDPVVAVHPDQLALEVFSKDEGSYARLSIDWDGVEVEGTPRCGTTNIDFSQQLFEGIQRIRSYRPLELSLGSASAQSADGSAPAIGKQLKLPLSWLRGFLQVQTAATVAHTRFTLRPIDFYNLLRHLRLNADVKRKGRALRVELVPGEAPRLVLEPWEEVIECAGEPYAGRAPQVVRIWGRRRLMLVRRLLPFLDSVEVHVMGSGLPSFWVFRAGAFTFTLGLSGFTAANWSQAISFDLLLPRGAGDADPELDRLVAWLADGRFKASRAELDAVGLEGPALEQALQRGCQNGQLMYDLASGVYRLRPLSAEPLDQGALRYRNPRERAAWDLIATDGAVAIETREQIPGSGLQLVGRATVAADKRDYRPVLLLDEDDGRVRKAECTCSFHRKNGLKHGPCAHLLALRIRHGLDEQARQAARGAARQSAEIETRSYTRRRGNQEQLVQLSLDRKKVRVRWGQRGGDLRRQLVLFNSIAEARADYFARVDELEARGYLDATAGGASA